MLSSPVGLLHNVTIQQGLLNNYIVLSIHVGLLYEVTTEVGCYIY